jgi:hypothetical protein
MAIFKFIDEFDLDVVVQGDIFCYYYNFGLLLGPGSPSLLGADSDEAKRINRLARFFRNLVDPSHFSFWSFRFQVTSLADCSTDFQCVRQRQTRSRTV